MLLHLYNVFPDTDAMSRGEARATIERSPGSTAKITKSDNKMIDETLWLQAVCKEATSDAKIGCVCT